MNVDVTVLINLHHVGHSRSNHTINDAAVYQYGGVQFQEVSTSVGEFVIKNGSSNYSTLFLQQSA